MKLEFERADIEIRGNEPNREVVFDGPSFGGYEPVAMLERLMKPIVVKAKRRQAGARGNCARVRVCAITDTVRCGARERPGEVTGRSVMPKPSLVIWK